MKHFVLIALVSILGVIVGCATSSSLHNAIRMGNISAVVNQLDKGVDVNARAPNLQTALMAASGKGHREIAKLLIDKGADVNYRNPYGRTALMTASGRGHREITKLLIERGADINAKDNSGKTAFTIAVSAASGNDETVKLLMDKGADVKSKEGALRLAALSGRVETVKLLIDKGADVNAKDVLGRTAFTIAASEGRVETVKLLIDKGADINIPPGKAILITQSDRIMFLGGRVYLAEIDGRQMFGLGLSSMTTLLPGVHNIKVRYLNEGILKKATGKPISLSINVKSGHIYAVKYEIKEKKWTAWIDKIK